MLEMISIFLALTLVVVSCSRSNVRYMLLLEDLVTSNSESVQDCVSLCKFLRSKLIHRKQEGVSQQFSEGPDGDSSNSSNSSRHIKITSHPTYQILNRYFLHEENQKSVDSELYGAIKLQLSNIIDNKLLIMENKSSTSVQKSDSKSSIITERDLLSQAYGEMKRNKEKTHTFRTRAQVLYGQYEHSRRRRSLLFKVRPQRSPSFEVKLDLVNTPEDLFAEINKEYTNETAERKGIRIYKQEGSKRREILLNNGNIEEDNDKDGCTKDIRSMKDKDLLIDAGFKYPGANIYVMDT